MWLGTWATMGPPNWWFLVLKLPVTIIVIPILIFICLLIIILIILIFNILLIIIIIIIINNILSPMTINDHECDDGNENITCKQHKLVQLKPPTQRHKPNPLGVWRLFHRLWRGCWIVHKKGMDKFSAAKMSIQNRIYTPVIKHGNGQFPRFNGLFSLWNYFEGTSQSGMFDYQKVITITA